MKLVLLFCLRYNAILSFSIYPAASFVDVAPNFLRVVIIVLGMSKVKKFKRRTLKKFSLNLCHSKIFFFNLRLVCVEMLPR